MTGSTRKARENPILFRKKKQPREFVILIVCSANQTRSPYMAAMLRKKLRESDVRFRERVVVESAGTQAVMNAPVYETVKQYKDTKYRNNPESWKNDPIFVEELDGHRSRRITEDIIRRASLILTMEEQQKKDILAAWPELENQVYLITEYGRSPGDPAIQDVYDPTEKARKDPDNIDLSEWFTLFDFTEEEAGRILHYMVTRGVIE